MRLEVSFNPPFDLNVKTDQENGDQKQNSQNDNDVDEQIDYAESLSRHEYYNGGLNEMYKAILASLERLKALESALAEELVGCSTCDYDEAEGVLINHCKACQFDVTALAWDWMHGSKAND